MKPGDRARASTFVAVDPGDSFEVALVGEPPVTMRAHTNAVPLRARR